MRIFQSDGTFLSTFGRRGGRPGEFHTPRGVATDQSCNVYVADTKNNRIQVFRADGVFLKQKFCFVVTSEHIIYPLSLTVGPDSDGKDVLYVACQDQILILKLDNINNASWISIYKSHVGSCVACDAEGRIYVSDPYNGRIDVLSRQFRLLRRWGEYLKLEEFWQPSGIVIGLYVGDVWHNCVEVFQTTGEHVRTLSPEPRYRPNSLSFDIFGRLYVYTDANLLLFE